MSKIRQCFKSRFPEGRLLEIDFSQLEIYVLAHLSGGGQLAADLLSGADLHGISAELLYGPHYSDKQRKIAKSLSFQLQYGAGAKSMSEDLGIPISECKKFIRNYYARYPEVKEWQDSVADTVKASRKPSRHRTPKGLPSGVGTYTTATGRYYVFRENDAPDFMVEKGIHTSFSPTQMKNYPVQGFATGDIVPMILGKLYRALKSKADYAGKVLMVGTVHDSVVFDCFDYDMAYGWAYVATDIMEEAPKYLKEHFNIDFDLPLKVEAEVGTDWYDMKKLDFF